MPDRFGNRALLALLRTRESMRAQRDDEGAAADPLLAEAIERLEWAKWSVEELVLHQNAPPPPPTDAGGWAYCDVGTGLPRYGYSLVADNSCLWSCVEAHERSHVEFLLRPCQRVHLAFARGHWGLRRMDDARASGDTVALDRAGQETRAAFRELQREMCWYYSYLDQTCRFNEWTAYQAGIEACRNPVVRARCAAAGQLRAYERQMAAWRRFMQNPPNCPVVRPGWIRCP